MTYVYIFGWYTLAYPEFCVEGPENLEERGGEWGGGIPFPSRLGDLGSVISSPSGVRGSAENGFWCILSFKKRIW